MKDNYTFPAIFDYSDSEYISIQFPSFPFCMTEVESNEDPVLAAQELLALTIKDYEDDNKELPDSSPIVELEENQNIYFINVWMPFHRSKIKETYVKKTLTIPSWLDILAKQNNINFSAVLVDALKNKLGI